MSILNGDDLLVAGWPEGPALGRALKKAAEYEARGITDRAYLLKLLRRDEPPPDKRIPMRGEAAAFSEAIEAATEADADNIAKVRRFMRDLLKTPVLERGALMPDACPAGAAAATIPVGGAIAARNAILPSAHSADICCSMYVTFFRTEKEVGPLMDDILASTRFGMGGRKEDDLVHHPVLDENVWTNPFLRGLERHARIHMADQGDGNHFAYLGRLRMGPAFLEQLEQGGLHELAEPLRDAAGCHALVTHHGSRGLGAQLYARGQKAALAHVHRVAEGVPPAAAWLDYESKDGREYWEALQYVSRWTRANHESIHARFLEKSGAQKITAFGNEHNFVWKRGDLFLHGKGATPAWKDDDGRPLPGLIPMNMAEPILFVLGRDNAEHLSFAPHGAGRNHSRTAINRTFNNEFGETDTKRLNKALKDGTKGLDVRWFYGKPDITETPVGYKPAATVKAQIEKFGLADVIAEITPLGCVMAGDSGPPPWIRRKQELTPKQLRAIDHRADRRKERTRLLHAADSVPEDEDLD